MIHRHIHKAFKHAFVPHEGNDFRPHFLREHTVLTIVIISILFLLLSATSYLVLRKTVYGTLVVSSVLIDFTNQTRQELGLPPLYRNSNLDKSSLLKAKEMDTLAYFSHESPDGTAPWKFFRAANYEYAYAGENLALNFPTSKKVHDGWLNSPKHRDNIVDPRYKEIGISVISSVYAEKPVLFVVQHFGLPKEILNRTEKVASYSSLPEKILFSGSRYIELFYFFLIAIICMALLLMIIIEVEERHKKHILYGFLMLILVIICSLTNAQLLG